MLTLTCQLTYPDACRAAGAWTRAFVASVGLIPILLKVHDPEVHHDDAGHRPLHPHRQPDPRRARRRTPVDHHRRERRPQERRPPAGARARPGPGRPGPVPPTLQGTNPVPQFDAIVSCQTISAAGAATVTNVSTAAFPASTVGKRRHQRHGEPAPSLHRPHRVRGLARLRLVRSDRGVEARASSPRRGRAGSPQAGPLPAPPALRHVRRQPVTLDNLARTAGQGAQFHAAWSEVPADPGVWAFDRACHWQMGGRGRPPESCSTAAGRASCRAGYPWLKEVVTGSPVIWQMSRLAASAAGQSGE